MDKSFEFCIGEEEESFVLLLDDEAPILEWLFDNLFVFKSFLFSVLSPFSVFVCPEVVDGVSVEFNDSEDIRRGSTFPSLLPDKPFSALGFLPFLPFNLYNNQHQPRVVHVHLDVYVVFVLFP